MLPCSQPPTLAFSWLKAYWWSHSWHAQKFIRFAANISRDSLNVHFRARLQAKQKAGLNGGLILVIHHSCSQHREPKYWKPKIPFLKVRWLWGPQERLYGNRFFENCSGIRDAQFFQYLRRPYLAYWLYTLKNNSRDIAWGLMGGEELVTGSL